METNTEEKKCCATPVTDERLEALGFTSASKTIKQTKEFNRKCMIAYENFRYVKQERIDEFNQALRKKSEKEVNRSYHYDALVFRDIKDSVKIPPANVLDLLEKAKDMNCFDSFEIAAIERQVQTPDPILFGRIKGNTDRFFIGQWDDDVKIEDLIKSNEG